MRTTKNLSDIKDYVCSVTRPKQKRNVEMGSELVFDYHQFGIVSQKTAFFLALVLRTLVW